MKKADILLLRKESENGFDIEPALRAAGYEISGNYSNIESAVAHFEDHPADIILVDADILDGTGGIKFAHTINAIRPTPIIFLIPKSDTETAPTEEYRMPSAYVLKPFNSAELTYGIELALEELFHDDLRKKPSGMPPQDNDNHVILFDRLFLKRQNKFIKLELDEILWVEAKSNYVEITAAHSKHLIAMTLKAFCEKIPYPKFVRVHRSYMVNMEHVEGFEDSHVFIGGKELPISATYKQNFLNKLQLL